MNDAGRLWTLKNQTLSPPLFKQLRALLSTTLVTDVFLITPVNFITACHIMRPACAFATKKPARGGL